MRLVKSAECAAGKSGFFTVLGTSVRVHLYARIHVLRPRSRARARSYASVVVAVAATKSARVGLFGCRKPRVIIRALVAALHRNIKLN